MSFIEKKTNGTTVYNGKIIKVDVDDIAIDANGKLVKAKRELVYHPGGVCALIRTPENKIKFVTQYRYAFSSFLLELPAGKREKDELPLETIKREVEEEVGIIPLKIEEMGSMYLSPGISNEVIFLFYIDSYEITNQHFDEDEFLDVSELEYDEALEMIEKGIIKDAKTICLLLKCKDKFH